MERGFDQLSSTASSVAVRSPRRSWPEGAEGRKRQDTETLGLFDAFWLRRRIQRQVNRRGFSPWQGLSSERSVEPN